MSSIKEIIRTTPFTTSTYRPMSRINIDSIGPLPSDQYGNTYILVMIDCFSRFVELYPIKAVDAIKTVPCLVDFVCRYGMPNYILSDRGKQFCNETIKGTLAALGVKHIQAMAYSKEENALVERANKEVMRHLRAIIHELRKESWSDGLPLVRRIMNASPNDTI
jgi:transposase InsO family protein